MTREDDFDALIANHPELSSLTSGETLEPQREPAGEMRAGTVVAGMLDNGQWAACFGLSYRDLSIYDTLGPKRIVRPGGSELRKVTGAGGISAGRNEVARRFLDSTDGEWLWMVDTDMGFAPDTVERLIESAETAGAPVMGALCFCLRGNGHGDLYAERYQLQPTLYDFVTTDTEVGFRAIGAYPIDAITQVAGTGAACVLIHRSALERIAEKHGPIWYDLITHPTGDRGKPRTFSEDLSFCIRLASVGMPIFVDTSVKTTHDKGGIFLDDEMYWRQEAFRAVEANLNQPPDGEAE